MSEKNTVAHTPGPWTAFKNSAGMYEAKTCDYEYAPTIAYIVIDGDDGGAANARLIAASPDLAAALLAILAEVTPGPVPPHSADSYLPAHLIEQARAALEKAGAV